jgi:hypothetical protein
VNAVPFALISSTEQLVIQVPAGADADNDAFPAPLASHAGEIGRHVVLSVLVQVKKGRR